MSVVTRVASLTEGVIIAIDALRANKVRAALTILGVAIGVFVVVIISAAIHGINASVAREFESAGPTTFFLSRFPISLEACDGSDETCKWRYNPPIRLNEAAAIGRLSTIRAVTARNSTSASVKHADRNLSSISIIGFTANWLEVDGGDIYPGRSFTPAENEGAARVIILNTKAAERLFGEADPIGKTVSVAGTPFQVIGVYRKEASFFDDQSAQGTVPFQTARRVLKAPNDWVDLAIKPLSTVERDAAIDDVIALLRGQRGLKPAVENNFAIITQDKLFETWGKMTTIFFFVMFVLSAVGLIVGGVGVVAIMMISVTERTREIGVRKALGATRGTILWQFLIEAITLTGIGAASGLLFGWFISWVIRVATPIQTSIPPASILVAVAASVGTGVLFGLLPAIRASRLDPVTALRYE